MRLDDYDAILCDLDGCLISGTRVLPGAQALIARAGARLIILSNNSTDTPASLSQRLAAMGLEAPAERIVLAGTAALDHLAQEGKVRLCLYGSAALTAHARGLGLTLDRERPSHVLLTRDEDFAYGDLKACVGFLRGGARLLVANPDESHPGPQGEPVPETGSLLAAILSVLPGLEYTVIGKPEAGLYRHAMARLPAGARRLLAIGDNPATDGVGAERLGLDYVLIGPLSDRYRDLDALLAEPSAEFQGASGAAI